MNIMAESIMGCVSMAITMKMVLGSAVSMFYILARHWAFFFHV